MIATVLFGLAFKLPSTWPWLPSFVLIDWVGFRFASGRGTQNRLLALRIGAVLLSFGALVVIQKIGAEIELEACRHNDNCILISVEETP
jgi:hypothetical protein